MRFVAENEAVGRESKPYLSYWRELALLGTFEGGVGDVDIVEKPLGPGGSAHWLQDDRVALLAHGDWPSRQMDVLGQMDGLMIAVACYVCGVHTMESRRVLPLWQGADSLQIRFSLKTCSPAFRRYGMSLDPLALPGRESFPTYFAAALTNGVVGSSDPNPRPRSRTGGWRVGRSGSCSWGFRTVGYRGGPSGGG